MKKEENFQETLVSQDIADAALKIPAEEIEQRLFEFSETVYWPLVVRYFSDRINAMKDNLAVFDPKEELVKLCRAQGSIIGLLDLMQAINIIQNEKKESLKEETEKNREALKKV